MAGAHSDDEEMNYWPGFVDALSTMTMMLIFLMMILSLTIVSVSQHASRNQVMAIAQAAKIDTSGSPASLENLTSQIIEALSRLSQNQKQNTPEAPKNPVDMQKIPDPSASAVETQLPNLALDPGEKIASQGTRDAVSRIQSKKKAEFESSGGGTEMQVENASLTLLFPSRAVKPDDQMKVKFNNFVMANRGSMLRGPLEVQAMANTQSGQVTEARRLAYYRAMVTRQMLMDANFDPRNIRVKVIDSPSSDEFEYVYIVFQH